MASATISSPRGAPRPMALAGHSGPLRYANAEDLPSYPSPGLKRGDAAASAAATLGWATSPASPNYAVVGSASPREHQFATPRSQDALLAAGRSQPRQKPQSPPPSQWGPTAANLAFRGTKSPPPAPEGLELSRHNSMRAAKDAMAGARPRARSSPQTPAEMSLEESAGAAALSAATIAHRPSVRANTVSAGDAGAVPYTTMDRQMFTSNPPVKPEVDERNRADVLHASALAMARKMYDQQQKMIDHSARAHARSKSLPGGDGDAASLASSRNDEPPPIMYNSLQEAAYRLAQERLAKLQEEHDKQRTLQDYYGASTPQRTKFGTIKGKLSRRRSSSDGDLLLEDKRRSEQIRKQMSLLNNKLSEVDEEKRTQDREALLAAAQRNVRAQMQLMDQKVQSDTGRVPKVDMEDWGRKALVAAQVKTAAGNHADVGKVDVGGGMVMDREEVERIAAEKVQPLLDEISDLAEKERERLEAERLDEERRREKAEIERMREREIHEIHRKLKDQQKEDERARKAEIKHEEKIRKEEAKALKSQQKHATKEEREQENNPVLPPATSQPEAADPNASSTEAGIKRSSTAGRVRGLSINFGKRQPRHKGKDATDKSPTSPDDISTSPTHKVRAWLLSRFPRPRAKSASTAAPDDQDNNKKGFIGGAALSRLRGGANDSTHSVGSKLHKHKARDDGEYPPTEPMNPDPYSSMRDVAMAGRAAPTTTTDIKGDEPGESSHDTTAVTKTTITTRFSNPQMTTSTRPPERPISQVSQASMPASLASAHSVSSMSVSSSTGHGHGHVHGQGSSSSVSIAGRSSVSVNSDGDDDEQFVEARSEPESNGGGAGGVGSVAGSSSLAPPSSRGGGAMAGRISPFRESRFSEIL